MSASGLFSHPYYAPGTNDLTLHANSLDLDRVRLLKTFWKRKLSPCKKITKRTNKATTNKKLSTKR